MSVYKVGESEEYDKSARVARQLLSTLSLDPNLQNIKELFWKFLYSIPSAPIKVLTSFSDNRYYPLVLSLRPGEFGTYLSQRQGVVVAARSREQIAALLSVYETARSRIDLLDTEFRKYIDQISKMDQSDLENLRFPPDKIMQRFCAPALLYSETKDILLGLPCTASENIPNDLLISSLSDLALVELKELASKIKSRALNRFYLAFLSSFALRFIDCYEPPADAWSLLESGEAFSCAIADGLLAVEYPESLIANMPHLLGLIASFEPESP
jgi:hypothetical protein